MTAKKRERKMSNVDMLRLVGWDDGKVYFYDEEDHEYCVNKYPELFRQIIKKCAQYFKGRKTG